MMMAIIAVLCSVSFPADCHERTVTTSDFADVSMQSCLMGAQQLADWMNQHPTERPCGMALPDGRRCMHRPGRILRRSWRAPGFPALSGSGLARCEP